MNAKKSCKILMIGAPGSGKGTQARKIAQHLGYKHVSTGDLLRLERKNVDCVPEKERTATQNEIVRSTDKGSLAGDDVVYELLEKKIRGLEKYVLDGFPRNLNQASKVEVDLAIFVDTDSRECVRRICNRQEGRADDNEEVAKYRMNTYFKETMPLVDYYKKKGVLAVVDGNQSAEAVASSISRLLK